MSSQRDRILTTHVGSLPRSSLLTDLLIRRESGESIDHAALNQEIERSVAYVVQKQADVGIDVANDGEQQRVGFQTYIPQRMTGFGGESQRKRSAEYDEFPAFTATLPRRFPNRSKSFNAPQAIGPVQYVDRAAVKHEIDCFLARASCQSFADRFITAPSPGIIATTMHNAYYESYQKYLLALAKEIRNEYLAIVDAGLILQIDAPDLAMERVMFARDMSERDYLTLCEMHVDALNDALTGIPPQRVRLHCCWGNWEGPHIHDIALASVLPILYGAHVGALSIEFANPRHQHEYAALRATPLPSEMVLLPGVIDSTTNIVEHPEVVARRLEEAVAAVGDRDRVIASTDCGFGTFAGYEWVAEDVVWAKLRSLREGADIASRRLWGREAAA